MSENNVESNANEAIQPTKVNIAMEIAPWAFENTNLSDFLHTMLITFDHSLRKQFTEHLTELYLSKVAE